MIRNRRPDEKVYIYKLIDPTTQLVGYVGQTNNPKLRLTRHLSEARQDRFHCRRNKWIGALLSKGVTPLLVIIQEVSVKAADLFECYWIFHFLNKGYSLTNDTDRLPGGRMGNDKFRSSKKLLSRVENQLALFESAA